MSKYKKRSQAGRPAGTGPGRPRGSKRRLRVRSERRSPVDVRKVARTVIALALSQAQAEAEAQQEHEAAHGDDRGSAGGADGGGGS